MRDNTAASAQVRSQCSQLMIPHQPHGASEIFPHTSEKPPPLAVQLLWWELTDLALQIPVPGVDFRQVARFGLLVQARRFDEAAGAFTEHTGALQIALKLLLTDFDVKLGHFRVAKEALNRSP